MPGLSPRRKKFCEEYALTGNGQQAAVAAGYSPGSARQQASRLLTNDDILTYIRELQEKMSDARILSGTEIKMLWSDLARDDSQKTADRLTASGMLARAQGMFIMRSEVRTDISTDAGPIICLPAIKGVDGSWKDPPRQAGNIIIFDPAAPPDFGGKEADT